MRSIIKLKLSHNAIEMTPENIQMLISHHETNGALCTIVNKPIGVFVNGIKVNNQQVTINVC